MQAWGKQAHVRMHVRTPLALLPRARICCQGQSCAILPQCKAMPQCRTCTCVVHTSASAHVCVCVCAHIRDSWQGALPALEPPLGYSSAQGCTAGMHVLACFELPGRMLCKPEGRGRWQVNSQLAWRLGSSKKACAGGGREGGDGVHSPCSLHTLACLWLVGVSTNAGHACQCPLSSKGHAKPQPSCCRCAPTAGCAVRRAL